MKQILTPAQMNKVDDFAIRKLHIPSLRLMENAGLGVVAELESRIKAQLPVQKKEQSTREKCRVLIFCGKGNNGGDGFVVARLLIGKGYPVTVILISARTELKGDAGTQFTKLQDCKSAKLGIIDFGTFRKKTNKKFEAIVDAMLGTSFQGTLLGKYRKAVQWCNKQSAIRIAVDIPTGLNGETGEVLTDAFRADVTVTMSMPKLGFYCGRSKEFTGDVVISDIGIPKKLTAAKVPMLIEKSDVQKSFPRRAVNSHKHSVGKIFALAGSKSMMGAALLCSQSAMRSGAGQVILGVPDSEYSVIAKRSLEVMPLGLINTIEGSISLSALDEIEKRIKWSNVLLTGCGLSRSDETQEMIRNVIRSTTKPMVIDADALHALIGNLDILKIKKGKKIVLTPHGGEFSRLIGIPSAEIESNRFLHASNFAKEYHVTLVLKGAPTIIADPEGKIFVNSTGNPGMSTAGSGDVLAGIIASLMGQGNSPLKAALNGVWIQGRAGDLAAHNIGMYGMIASDIIRFIPAAIREVTTL